MPSMTMQPFLTQDQITKRVAELAAQINTDYSQIDSPLVIVCVLKGSLIFTADLVRHLTIPIEIECMSVKSYEGTKSTQACKTIIPITGDISKRHILVVEDIIDTGLTIKHIYTLLEQSNPLSLKLCTLLLKPDVYTQNIPIDYTGFSIENKFVVGYGLDLDGRYRELPEINQMIGTSDQIDQQ